MEITGSSIAGYAFGLPSLLVGLTAGLFGVLFLVTGTSRGVSLLLFGIVLTIAGSVATPVLRRLIKSQLGISFSRPAVVGISALSTVLATLLFVITIIGLISSTGSVPPGADVSNVSMSAQNVNPETADHQLEIIWNARAQSGVDPDTDDFSSYSAEDGEKFVVVRMEVTNVGDGEIELTPRFFQFESSGVRHDYQGLFGSSDGFSGITLSPGATHEGWIVFSVSEDTTTGVLVTNQDAYFDQNVSVAFTHDERMAIDVAD